MAILKRDGSVQEFDVKKIEMAVMKAMIASGSPEIDAPNEAFAIGVEIEAIAGGDPDLLPANHQDMINDVRGVFAYVLKMLDTEK